MSFWLLQTLSDVDTDLVERAAQPPAVKEHRPARKHVWMSIVAAAACVALVVGMWQGGLFAPNTPPKVEAPNYDTNTTPTENTTTEPTSGGEGDGIGGDENVCTVHGMWYHSIPFGHNKVGKDLYDGYFASLPKYNPFPKSDKRYPIQDCNYPDSNIVAYVQYCGVSREEFIRYMGWDRFIDEMGMTAFLNHRYTWNPLEEERGYELFTFGEYLDAIYGDDPQLSEWVFNGLAASTAMSGVYYEDDWKHQYHYQPDDYYQNPLKDYLLAQEEWQDRDPYAIYQSGLSPELQNIIDFLKFCNIDREKYIEIYGWGDKLDEKATEHFKYAPYTYRQFVDAIYGDDSALRAWVFGAYVFHPDYPTLQEFTSLTEEDRFYAPVPVTDDFIVSIQTCPKHNPIYHDFETYFSAKDIRKFKKAFKDRDPEELNIINYVKYYGITREEFIEVIGFAPEEADMEMQWMLAERHGENCPYTYAEFVDAIYGDDPELVQRVFAPDEHWWETK